MSTDNASGFDVHSYCNAPCVTQAWERVLSKVAAG
jgi:hypothetical protein